MAVLIALMVLFFILLPPVCVYALWKGGPDERWGAATIIGAVIASQAASLFGSNWREPELGVMAVDAAIFLAFLLIAHRSRKFWPLWASSFQLVGTITHLAVFSQGTIIVEAYASSQPFWAIPVTGSLLVGSICHHREMRKV